jgi:hypothetical protein
MKKQLLSGCLLLMIITGCNKVTYNSVSNPAYLRVFNSLNYEATLDNKDNPPPFLTMIIDPVFDDSGHISGGNIIGDYLDERLPYAPPYPTNAGSTSTINNEYPGNEKVLVGPVVNGFDLSSWAQVPSGTHRIQFYSRSKTTVPFLQLPVNGRQSLLVDTTVTLTVGEVYTMEVLQKDITSQANIAELYIRNEQFTKLPLADSLTYVNFYNLSAEGYAAANWVTYDKSVIRDTINIYYTLYSPDGVGTTSPQKNVVPGYQYVPLTTLIRSHTTGVATYYPMPLFAGKDTTGGVYSHIWQEFMFLTEGYTPATQPFTFAQSNGNYAVVDCSESYSGTAYYGDDLPNLNVLTPSGANPYQSFSTVSSMEWINNRVYLMSVQRQYAAPISY